LIKDRRAGLAYQGRHLARARATATAVASTNVDDVYIYLAVVLNIYAVVDIVFDPVVATIYVVHHVALVAVNVA
jgi:hypothetical protein